MKLWERWRDSPLFWFWYRWTGCPGSTYPTAGQGLGHQSLPDTANRKHHPQQDTHRTRAGFHLQRICACVLEPQCNMHSELSLAIEGNAAASAEQLSVTASQTHSCGYYLNAIVFMLFVCLQCIRLEEHDSKEFIFLFCRCLELFSHTCCYPYNDDILVWNSSAFKSRFYCFRHSIHLANEL